MDFNFRYNPQRLINVRVDIENRHKIVVKKLCDENSIKNLKVIIEQIMKIDISEYKSYALKLKSEELYLLADYIAENKYNVEISKIYMFLKTRDRKAYANIFLNNFQNIYNNNVFNACFSDYIKNRESKVFNIKNTYIENLIDILGSKDVIKSFLNRFYEENISLKEYLLRYRINIKSNFAISCRRAVFLYCRKQHYLMESAEVIVNTVKEVEKREVKIFINNYLSKLEINDFQYDVMNYLYGILDKPTNKEKAHYWKYIDNEATKKYDIWLKKKVLKEFFGNDKRSKFWYNYVNIMENYDIVKNRGQLFLDFGKFVVVEFNQTGNAAYIYDKAIFVEKYSKYVSEHNSISNNLLKNQRLAYDRIIHSGNWQYVASITIRRALNDF